MIKKYSYGPIIIIIIIIYSYDEISLHEDIWRNIGNEAGFPNFDTKPR
jgi:hypothetical protein